MARRETEADHLRGVTAPTLPSVRTTDGHIVEWDRQRIVRQIVEETKLVETFYGYDGATKRPHRRSLSMSSTGSRTWGSSPSPGPLIREIVNITLLEKGMIRYRNVSTRVGPAGLRCTPDRCGQGIRSPR